LRNLGQWVAGERAGILARRAALEEGFSALPGWKLLGCGAFFAYAEHPFALPSPVLAKRLVAEAGILLLPGTMFRPADDPSGGRELRIAFANIDAVGIAELIRRLVAFRP
jgi:aspartate/methionine/tyrosine aminotransferase